MSATRHYRVLLLLAHRLSNTDTTILTPHSSPPVLRRPLNFTFCHLEEQHVTTIILPPPSTHHTHTLVNHHKTPTPPSPIITIIFYHHHLMSFQCSPSLSAPPSLSTHEAKTLPTFTPPPFSRPA